MMRGRRLAGLGLLFTACGSETPTPARTPAPAQRPIVEEDLPASVDIGTPTTPPDEPLDPTTVEAVDVVVVKVVDPGGPPCGILHAVAAIEVEVLNGGPRLGLYVSCPADLQPRGMLTVGERLHVELHAKPQRWPKPARRLADDATPIRYARTLSSLRGDP